uniref:TLC domain-containing protein n=1 Tax=Arion vulgaris TaxID=1028688 RepID=A0A0B6ZI29_9EUPU
MLKINSFDLLEVLTYVFLWTTLYFTLCLWNSARSYEWHCRTVTTVHAIIVSCMAIYCTFRFGPWPFTDAGGPNSPLQVRTVSLCLGYFLFDVIWCLYFRTEGPAMMAHHFLSIAGLTWCLMSGSYGTELLATIGGAEITNPLLQFRWFLRETGRYKTLLGDIVDWAFMLLFGFFRIGFGSVLLYSYFQQDTDFWGRLGGVSIYIIGWIFFINIVNYAIRKYTRRYQAWTARSLPSDNFPSTAQDSDPKGRIDIINDQDIPSQREIKYGNRELILRKNCVVQENIES